MPAQPLSPTQLAEAAQLKLLFQKWQQSRKDAGEPSSQEAAAALLGFGQSALAQYLNGKIPLNVDASLKFAHLLGVSFDAFSPSIANQATKVAEIVTTNYDNAFSRSLDAIRVTDEDDDAPATVGIDMVALHLQAGIDGIETVPLFEDGGKHHVPRQWLEENDLYPKALLAIKIKGESMQPMMFEGDIAVVNTSDRVRKNGGVFAMNYNGQAVIKRLIYERREWYLASENPQFRPEPCKGADCIVIGRIVRFDPRNFRDRL
jgi:phage repressor protein C with HTH and peptisase S24 domain